MTILCAVTCLLQFVGLVALTGVLVCLVAVLRLMELAITLINPFTIFMLHQSGKIIIFGLRKSKKLTSTAYHKIRMDCGRAPVLEFEIGIRPPEVLYKRTAMSGLVEETFPREGDNYRVVQISEAASVVQDDEKQDEEEIKVHSPDELEVEKVDEDQEIEKADDDRETEKSGSEELGQTSDKEANETLEKSMGE